MALRVRCPICRQETPWDDNPHRPFCSERCRLIDLGAWTEERYRIPGQAINDDSFNRDPDNDDKKKLK